MSPAAVPQDDHVGPHPSFIEAAKPFIFEQQIQEALTSLAMTEAREDHARLKGVEWIDSVRKSLQLPVKTFNTAVVYYHKFRLLHADHTYQYTDAAAAALFTACKIEDTLKKSREILCASYNLKLPPAEQLSPDDPRFEGHSKVIVILERLMLEGAGFDFRSRQPNKLIVKLARKYGFDKEQGKTPWNMGLDLYKTFAPLKQTHTTMAIACIELAARLIELGNPEIPFPPDELKKWSTTRAEVMETLLDLLDLYTHHRTATTIGSSHPLETFISIRITLNQESASLNLPRYTEWSDKPKSSPLDPNTTPSTASNGVRRNGVAPTSPATPATPDMMALPGQGPQSAIGIRGQNGTVRFMLDKERAKKEKEAVEPYFREEMEEYEVEVSTNEPERKRIR